MFSVEYIQVCNIKCSLIIFFTFAKILQVLDSLSLGALPVIAGGVGVRAKGGKILGWEGALRKDYFFLTFQKGG